MGMEREWRMGDGKWGEPLTEGARDNRVWELGKLVSQNEGKVEEKF